MTEFAFTAIEQPSLIEPGSINEQQRSHGHGKIDPALKALEQQSTIHLAVTTLMPHSTMSTNASRPMAIDTFIIINFYEDMLSLLFDMQDGIDRHVDMAEIEFLNDKAKRLEHVSSLFNKNS